MCWWGLVEVGVLFVQTLALIGLFYLNYKNRKIARQALRKANEIGKHAEKVHGMVKNAVGEPPPPSVPDPPPFEG